MSFRDVRLGREGRIARDVHESGRARSRVIARRKDNNREHESKPPSSELFYSQLRLVPSASGDDHMSLSSSSSSSANFMKSASINPREPSRQVSNQSNQQSGSSSKSRGIPGFSTARRHGTTLSSPLNLRGWSQREHGDVVHITGASPSNDSKTSARVISDDLTDDLFHEVSHFQKLVALLEESEGSAISPEQKWKRRILIRSAQEADRDIAEKLNSLDSGRNWIRPVGGCTIDLRHDYYRSSKSLSEQQQRREQEEDYSKTVEEENPQTLLQQEESEDFFDRVIREREEEIKSINKKMHQVSAIYNDLANLIDAQQDQIDAVDENVYSAKSTADTGFKHIEYARDRLCVMGDTGIEVPQCGGYILDVEGDVASSSSQRETGCSARNKVSSGEKVRPWYKPFHSFQKDILGFGNDLASLSCSISENLECGRRN